MESFGGFFDAKQKENDRSQYAEMSKRYRGFIAVRMLEHRESRQKAVAFARSRYAQDAVLEAVAAAEEVEYRARLK